jgi:hypothetical protein
MSESMKSHRRAALVLVTCFTAASLHAQVPAMPDEEITKFVVVGTLVVAVLLLLTVLGLVYRLSKLETKLLHFRPREEDSRGDRERSSREKKSQAELAQWKDDLRRDLNALRDAIKNIPVETERRIAQALATQPRPVPTESSAALRSAPPAPAYREPRDTYDDPRGGEDGVAQLLTLANRIVQSSTTLDAFRASAGSVAGQVSVFPSGADGSPTAFIVEHRGAYYAVPNVVKPARLPKEWFNRSDFGVNDEIRRVLSLPRLTRHGDGYEVQEPGEFTR